MNRATTFLVVWLAAAVACAEEAAGGGRMDQVVAANNTFARALYQELGRAPGNRFFSPYSISTALTMTLAGARGQTAAEMERTLHLALPADARDAAAQQLRRHINGEGDKRPYELAVANALWAQSGLPYRQEFLDRLDRFYGAGLRQIDFHTDPEAARRTINGWVEDQTRDKIQDLFPPRTIDRDTELVLANAVYFKGRWQTVFPKSGTQEGEFFLTPEGKARVPLMHLLARLPYAEGPDFQALELPYAGGSLALLVLLPKARDGLPRLEQALDAATAVRLTARQVDVTLPRFKMTSAFKLNETLAALGMPSAFTSRADFSGISERGDLALSAVVHKAFVDVNEEGTEAAAATGVAIARMAAKVPASPPVTFRADHPFLFLIRDTRTGCILFLGRVADPSA